MTTPAHKIPRRKRNLEKPHPSPPSPATKEKLSASSLQTKQTTMSSPTPRGRRYRSIGNNRNTNNGHDPHNLHVSPTTQSGIPPIAEDYLSDPFEFTNHEHILGSSPIARFAVFVDPFENVTPTPPTPVRNTQKYSNALPQDHGGKAYIGYLNNKRPREFAVFSDGDEDVVANVGNSDDSDDGNDEDYVQVVAGDWADIMGVSSETESEPEMLLAENEPIEIPGLVVLRTGEGELVIEYTLEEPEEDKEEISVHEDETSESKKLDDNTAQAEESENEIEESSKRQKVSYGRWIRRF